MYDKCKKRVILAEFEATLLETKYIASKMFNNRSLNIKIMQFNGRIKHTPPVYPKLPWPRYQNTKCLVRATRAGGLRQHNRQVVRYRDAFSVALCRQTAGSDKLQTYSQKGQQAQRLCNNQLKHQQKMPHGFCGRSPNFRRLLPGDGEYSNTYRMFNLSVVVCAAGAAPTHHISSIMATDIIISKVISSM